MSIIDISAPLRPAMPVWPGSIDYRHEWTMTFAAGDICTRSHIRVDMHTATHIDAPLHFVEGAATVDLLDLEIFCGRARVVDLTHVDRIAARELAELNMPKDTQRLLFKTRNSRDLWGKAAFDPGYVALTPDGAEWIVERGIAMVGCDYLSVQRFDDGPEVHRILLGAGVGVLEGVMLGHVAPGEYELLCLPLKIVGAEGAPARAALRRIPHD